MRKTLRYSLLLLLSLFVGNGVFAADVTIDFSAKGYENNQSVAQVSQDGILVDFYAGTNSNTPKYYNTGTAIRCYGGNYFTVKASNATITKIVFTFASGEGSNEITADTGTFETATWTGSSASVKFTIGGTTGHRRIQKLVVTTDGSGSGGDTQTLATPVISGTTPFTGSTTVTITHEKEDAAIRYKKTGDTDWTDYSGAFSITETTTITAIAEWDDESDNTLTSEEVSKTFTKLTEVSTVRDFNALADGTANVVLSLTNAKVLAVGNNNCIINDGTAGTNIYKLPSDITVAQGTVLNGTITGTRGTYNGVPQIKDITANTLQTTAGTIEATAIQASALADAELLGALYKVENVTIKKNTADNRFYIYDGETQGIQVYNNFKIVDPAEGTWNIEGIRGVFTTSTATTAQFWLTKMEATQEITYTDMTVAELCALTANKDNINLTLDNALIAYKDGNSLYIREGENAICAFGITLDGVTWKQGQTISGTVKVNSEIYRGMHEIKSNVGTTKDNLTITDPEAGTTVEPTVATIAELLAGKHVADYIILKGVQVVSEETATAKGLNATTAVTYYAQDDNGDKIQIYTTAATYTGKANDGNKYDIKAIYASAVSGSENITPKGISETTGINNLKIDDSIDNNAPIYNLAGQRVGKEYKGVVIVNGKKVNKR